MGSSRISSLSRIHLNPKWSETEKQEALSLVAASELSDCDWIASSGSSQKIGDSVKMIALKRQALEASAHAVNRYFGISSRDVIVKVLPSFHVGGLGLEIRSQLSGARLLDGLQQEKWNPEYFCQMVEREQATFASLVPTQIFDLLQMKRPNSLRAILVGGAALPQDLLEKSLQAGWPLFPSFGMTEAGSTVAIAKGRGPMEVLPHLQAKISSEGLLQLRGESLLSGWLQKQNSQTVFNTGLDSDGWLTTADLAQLSGRNLIVQGRASDFVKILGEGVNLRFLNEKLSVILKDLGKTGHEALLFTKPHERRGAEMILVLEQSEAVLAQKICELFDQAVKPFERIQRQVLLEKIPRSDLGKPLLQKLQSL